MRSGGTNCVLVPIHHSPQAQIVRYMVKCRRFLPVNKQANIRLLITIAFAVRRALLRSSRIRISRYRSYAGVRLYIQPRGEETIGPGPFCVASYRGGRISYLGRVISLGIQVGPIFLSVTVYSLVGVAIFGRWQAGQYASLLYSTGRRGGR